MRPVNPLWYLAAFLFALGSQLAGAVVASGAWDLVEESTVSPASVRADARGQSLAVFTDIVQDDRDVRCRARAKDQAAVSIPAPSVDVMVDEEGNQWHLVGLLTEGADGLRVRCAPRDDRVDNASYAWAAVPGFESRVRTGSGIGWIGAAVGALFAGFVFHSRRQHRKETSHEPA